MRNTRRLLIALPATATVALVSAAIALGAAGDNDTGYGSKGIAQIPTGNGGRSSAAASIVQGDKLVVAGQATVDGGSGLRPEMALTRINADGSRDTSFGTNGESITAAGTGESEALGVALAPDGKIVAVGRAVDGPTTKIAIARFSANGQPDATFGVGGLALLNRGTSGVAEARGVLVEGDGSVVIAGTAVDGSANKITLARVTPAGISDGAWGSLTAAGDGSDTQAAGLTRLADGSYGVVGRATDGVVKLLVGRYASTTGQRTPGWGTTGTGLSLRDVGDGGATIGNALASGGGRILTAGSATDDNVGKTFVAAFSEATGQIDGSFGTGGASIAAIGTGGSSEATGIAFTAEGKLITAGSATQDVGGVATSQFVAARFLPTGGLDASFAPTASPAGASLVAASGLPAFGSSLALQPDGKALVAGRVGDGDGETLAVARFCTADGQTCTGPGAAPGGGGGGGGGTPELPRQPFECGKTVTFGIISAEGCLKEVDGRFEASGRVNVNGIIMQPEAKSTIVLDPKALRIFVDGPGKGAGRLSARLGSITIFENLAFDITLPSKSVAQFKLPGLKVSARGSVFGFPIGGSADLQLRLSGVDLTVNVSLPKIFGGVTGEVILHADLQNGFRADGIKITAKEALLGPLKVKDVVISYRDSDKRWSGKATVFLLPFPYGAQAEVAVQNGALKTLVAGIDGLNVSVGPGVFLQRISFGISVDPFAIQGGVGFTAGPEIAGVSAVRIDGNFRLSFPGSPLARIEIAAGSFCQISKCAEGSEDAGSGGLSVAGIPLGGFAFSADTDGQIAFSGNIGLDLSLVSFNAEVAGWLDGLRAFNVEGNGTVCLVSIACAGAEGVVSTEGLAACGYVTLLAVKVSIGFGIHWPFDLEIMPGACGIGDYRATRASAARLKQLGGLGTRQLQAPAPQSVTFPAGKPYALLRVSGDSAAPMVTLSGPDGASISTPAAPAKGDKSDRFLVIKDDEKKQTTFIVTKPGTQPWTLTPQPGSAAITAVEQAEPLPEPSVKARVTGTGYRRQLAYDVRRIEGQKVRFSEIGGGVTHVLGETTKAKGSIRFSPRDGAKGSRKIVAQVLQDDLPRANLTVAKYNAPARRLPGRIRTVSAKRGKTSLTIAWPSVANAVEYRVMVTVSDGRTLMLTVPRKSRKVTVPDFTAKDSAKVAVAGVTATMRKGPATRTSVKLPAKKKPSNAKKP